VAAFEEQFDYIHRSLRRHGISDSDADDLAQEVFLIMWRRWPDYDKARPVRPWLAGITFRVAYNHRDRIAREIPGGLVDTPDQKDGPEDQIVSGRVRALVLRALGQVPEKQRTAMILHHLDGLGVQEVARLTKVPLFTAYSRLRAGRRAFAAAVRRLNTVGGGPALARPEALLSASDPVPPSGDPAGSRSRARALLLPMLGPVVGQRPAGARAEATARSAPRAGAQAHPFTWLAAAGLVAATVSLVWLARGGFSYPPAAAAGDSGPARPRAQVAGNGIRGRRLTSAASGVRRPAPRLLPQPGAGAPARLADGMVGYWRFDEGRAAPDVVDFSGRANDCVPQRPERRVEVPGPHGGAFAFKGRSWLECPAVDPLARGGEEMSISVWVKRTGPVEEKVRALVSRQQGRGRADSFFLGFRAGQLLFGSDLWRVKLDAAFPAGRDRWVHVAATRARDRVARLYLDGVEVARKRSRPVTAPLSPTGGAAENALLIGAAMNGSPPRLPSERFVGSMDELVLYDRALPPEDVMALAVGAQPALSR
jgi:RNA polymerase sigma-70 factor, ECF subfamily